MCGCSRYCYDGSGWISGHARRDCWAVLGQSGADQEDPVGCDPLDARFEGFLKESGVYVDPDGDA